MANFGTRLLIYILLRVKQQGVVCSAFLRRKGDRLSISRFKDKVVCEPMRKILNEGRRNGGKFSTRFWACRGIVRFHCNKVKVMIFLI